MKPNQRELTTTTTDEDDDPGAAVRVTRTVQEGAGGTRYLAELSMRGMHPDRAVIDARSAAELEALVCVAVPLFAATARRRHPTNT